MRAGDREGDEQNRKKRATLPWWRHECHPKKYLDHLIGRGGSSYDEVQQGKDSLTALHWAGVPKSSMETPMIRSLFEDIAGWFGTSNPLGAGAAHPEYYPAEGIDRATLLLRNF